MKPRYLRNGKDSTAEDVIFSNKPTRNAVVNFRGYSPKLKDSKSLMNLARLDGGMSAYVFNFRQKIGGNASTAGKKGLT